ncbi:hypothetical protein X801_02943, partial [Opisthorchis viverrini]
MLCRLRCARHLSAMCNAQPRCFLPRSRQIFCLAVGVMCALFISAIRRYPFVIILDCDQIHRQSFVKLRRQNASDHNVTILCYINTHPSNYAHRAIHSRYTWARRCDKFFFTSTKDYPDLPVLKIDLEVPEIKQHLWVKMRKILREVYEFADQYDFFLKADDDAYVNMASLREALLEHSPDELFMTGFRWPSVRQNGFFSGGPGYLLSRSALKHIVEEAIDKHPKCPTTDEAKEDVKMSICGEAVGVELVDKFAETGKSIFYPYDIMDYFDTIKKATRGGILQAYKKNDPYLRRIHVLTIFKKNSFPLQLGLSRRHISFHYVDKDT